jgi:hypothetical protein
MLAAELFGHQLVPACMYPRSRCRFGFVSIPLDRFACPGEYVLAAVSGNSVSAFVRIVVQERSHVLSTNQTTPSA